MTIRPICILVGCLSCVTAVGASLDVTIVDEQGKAMQGARLSYSRLVDFYRGAGGTSVAKGPYVNRVVTVSADGRAIVKDLPAGRYNLCATGPQPFHLASCEWFGVSPRIVLGAGENASARLTVSTGIVITFRVRDNAARLRSSSRLYLGVMTDKGYYRRAVTMGTDGVASVYQVVVPKNLPTQLFLDGDVDLADNRGVALSKRQKSLAISGSEKDVTVDLSTR